MICKFNIYKFVYTLPPFQSEEFNPFEVFFVTMFEFLKIFLSNQIAIDKEKT